MHAHPPAPPAHRAQVTVQVLRAPSAPNGFLSLCLAPRLAPGQDIVLLEPGLHQGWQDEVFNSTSIGVQEQLMRQLMKGGSNPALVLMQVSHCGNHWQFCLLGGCCRAVTASR
jgi:hypothetical protein